MVLLHILFCALSSFVHQTLFSYYSSPHVCRYSLKSIDPVLMAPTCVFLASKVEVWLFLLVRILHWHIPASPLEVINAKRYIFFFNSLGCNTFVRVWPFMFFQEFGVVSNTRLISAATSVCK